MVKLLKDVQDGDIFEGVALVHRVSIRSSKNGEYAMGVISRADGDLDMKKWQCGSLEEGVYDIEGRCQVYNGLKSIIVSSLTPVEANPDDYLYSPYDQTLDASVSAFVKDLHPQARELFKLLLGGGERAPKLNAGFKHEYAALWHHDAYPKGLLAHSFKVGRLAKQMLSDPLYAGLYKIDDDMKDIIIVCALLHDLGKALEYDHGVISHVGRMVSHRTLMSERLALLKDDIISLYDEDAYWEMHSIFTQHHGQYEETPRTVAAFIVHLVDDFDAKMTDLSTMIQDPDPEGQITIKEPSPMMKLLCPPTD
jgi:hypothetical protein